MTKEIPHIVARELAYEGKAFSVYRYIVQLGERTLEREVLERKHGVVVVAVDEKRNVLMLREYCVGSNSYVLSLPGGSIENGKDPEQEALRELREETGFSARRIEKLRFAYSHPSTSIRKSFVFLAQDLYRDPLPSSEEILAVEKMPLAVAIAESLEDFVSDVSTIGNLLMARDRLAVCS